MIGLIEGRLSISLLVGVSPMPYAFILVGLTCSVTPMYTIMWSFVVDCTDTGITIFRVMLIRSGAGRY